MGKNSGNKSKKAAPKANGYPAADGCNGKGNGVANGIANQPTTAKDTANPPTTAKEIYDCTSVTYDAVSVGQKVWLAKNIMTNGKNGIHVSAYWGDEGEVVEKDPEMQMVKVIWSGNKNVAAKVFPQTLMLRPFPFKSGEWVRVSHCEVISGWFSGQILKAGHPVLVLDMRNDDKGGYECLVRALPYCARGAWELTISSENLTQLPMLPPMKLAPPDELYDGYKAGDLVYATEDIPTFGNDPPGIQIGRGDVGVIFSWWGPDEVDELLLVCFEKRRDNGKQAYIYMRLNQLSRTPPLVRGRRVQIMAPMNFPSGACVNRGDLGTLLECRADGDSQDLVRPDDQPGVEPYAFDAPPGTLTAIVENEPLDHRKEERLMLIENIAAKNEKEGRALENISLLNQNAFPVLGFGTGVGMAYCAGGYCQSNLWTCLPIMSETFKCTIFQDKSADGMDGTLSKETGSQFSHQALIGDKSRVDPYTAAIQRDATGTHVLDIGTGMMCLLARLSLRAGANSVDAVEVSGRSIVAATAGFDNEAAKHRPAADDQGNLIPDWASLEVANVSHEQKAGANPRLTVHLEGEKPRNLRLFEGYSSDTSLGLTGGYTLLVHEILGDMAGTECAARVVKDIRQRGLCASNCSFIPRSASTMIAPSTWVRLSMREKAMHRFGHFGEGELRPLSRYQVRHFPQAALIADPQPLEVLDFGGDLQLHQTRDLEFRTVRDDEFDGIHLHLFAKVGDDPNAIIDVLMLQNGVAPDGSRDNVSSSWNTMYVRLYEKPVPLPKGSRIRLQCVADLEGEVASYSIKASVGEKGEEQHHVEYAFKGC